LRVPALLTSDFRSADLLGHLLQDGELRCFVGGKLEIEPKAAVYRVAKNTSLIWGPPAGLAPASVSNSAMGTVGPRMWPWISAYSGPLFAARAMVRLPAIVTVGGPGVTSSIQMANPRGKPKRRHQRLFDSKAILPYT